MRRTLAYIPHSFFEIASVDLGPVTFYVGWLLIGWTVFSIGFLVYLISQQGWNQDTKSYLPVMILVALAMAFVLPNFEVRDADKNPVGLPIRGYGMMVMLGAVSGIGLAIYRARKMGLHHDVIMQLAFWMCIFGMLGARAFYVIQKWPEVRVLKDGQLDVGATLFSIIGLQSGGLVVYGSVIGAVAAAVIYLRNKKIPILAVGDIIAPSMLVGLWLGRIGCALNGCCYGGLCEDENPFRWSALTFPRDAEPRLDQSKDPAARENSPPYQSQRMVGLLHGVRVERNEDDKLFVAAVDESQIKESGIPGASFPQVGDEIHSVPQDDSEEDVGIRGLFGSPTPRYLTADGKLRSWSIEELPPRSLPVHPTQVYSSINAALMALFLWFLYPFRQRDGQVFATMLLIYPIARTMLEWIRDDERGQFGTALTISQWFSVLVVVLAASLLWWIFRRTKDEGLTESFAAA